MQNYIDQRTWNIVCNYKQKGHSILFKDLGNGEYMMCAHKNGKYTNLIKISKKDLFPFTKGGN